MTEQHDQTQLAAPAKPSAAALVKMGDTGIQISNMDDLWRFANMVHASGFAPYGMDTVEKIAISIEYGMELGIAPMQALQGMYVVNGKPSVYGDLFLALCKSDPRWDENRFAEWFTGNPYDDDFTAHCQMARVGISNPHIESFSVADAKLAKLWGKTSSNGKPTPWVTSPKRMLKMRSRTFCGRDTFPERLRGLTTVEEAQDIIDVEVRDARPAPIAMPRRIAQEAPPLAQGASAPPDTQAPQHEAPSTPDADGAGGAKPGEDLIPKIMQAIKAKTKEPGYDVLLPVFRNFELKSPVRAKDLEGWSEEELGNLLREVQEAQ